MFMKQLRYCAPKNLSGVLGIKRGVGQTFNNNSRPYSSDKCNKCCKVTPQTEGKSVEPWPKSDPPPPMWRGLCPQEPQPPNYDPYRIKVPDVVVPPLPPSHAKPMLDCAKIKGPCSVPAPPPPPPCAPPPPPPFPWIYVYVFGAFFTLMGLIYKAYLWKEERDKVSDSKSIWRPRRKTKRPYHAKDLPACVQYVIVGAGAAGWSAYRAIMEHDKTAKVLFITKEDCMPYVQPPMSKHMWWNPEPPDIKTLNFLENGKRHSMYLAECSQFLDPVKFYRLKRGPAVSIAAGWSVARVDADDHAVYVRTLCGEQPVYYERCLLAPGSKPKNLSVFKSAPKAVRDKVCTLRTVRDLELAFRRVREARRVTIVGGGVLGTELAWHLGRMNDEVERGPNEPPVEVVHVFKDKGLLAGVLPSYLGEWAAEVVRAQNVQIVPSTQVYDAFPTEDGRLELTLSNGTSLVTDFVLVAVGAEPRTDIAEASCLEQDRVNGGFLVNTEMQARTHLYVAGDAASIYSQWKDTRIRFDHISTAMQTGALAGVNMTGHWAAANMEPHYNMRLGTDVHMEVVGEVGACMPTIGLFKPCADELVPKAHDATTGAGDQPCYKTTDEYKVRYKRGLLFYLRDETVVGMVFWNIPPVEDRREVATEILRARPSYKDINMLASLLGFPEAECALDSDTQVKKVNEAGPCIKNWKYFEE